MLSKFFRNAAFITAAEIVTRAKGILILPLLARYLSTADFGVWAQVSVLVFTLSPLVMLGTESGVMRYLPGVTATEQRRQFAAWLIFVLLAAAIMAGVILVLGDWFAQAWFGSVHDYAPFMPLAAASLFATTMVYAGRTWFLIGGKGRSIASIAGIQAVLSVAAPGIAVLLDADVRGVIAANIAVDVIVGLGVLVAIARAGVLTRPDFSVLRPVIRFGLPLLPAVYAMWGLNWMDRLFLVRYRNLEEVGIYSVAYGLGYVVVQVITNPMWAMYPSAATDLHNRGDLAGANRLLHVAAGTMAAVAIPAVAGLWALDVPIIRVIAGMKYEAGALIVPLVAAGYACHMLASFGDISSGLAHRQYLASVSLIAATAVNFGLNLLWVPAHGMHGAAAATTLAFVIQFILSVTFATMVGPFWRSAIVPVKIIAATAVMAVAARWLTQILPVADILQLVIVIPVAVLLYAAVGFALGVMPPSARDFVQASIPQWAKWRLR